MSPIYRYRCKKCRVEWEEILPPHKREQICPRCEEPVSPVMARTSPHTWGRGGKP